MYKKNYKNLGEIKYGNTENIPLNIFKFEYINREKRRPCSANNRLDKTLRFLSKYWLSSKDS